MASANVSWNLESFIDALVVELDKARETLAVKSLNKSLTYTVKDMALDLQIFPSFDGEQVKFVTAKPGEDGASKITLKLDSITDQVVRATSKGIPQKGDVSLDTIGLDDDTEKSLRKIGVTSVKELQELEKKEVDIDKLSKKKIDFGKLSNLIQKKKRDNAPPQVNKTSMAKSAAAGNTMLTLEGKNLAVNQHFQPVVALNNIPVKVLHFDENRITVELSNEQLQMGTLPLVVIPDEYAVFRINIKSNV